MQTFIFVLYRTLLVVGSPFIVAYLLWRGAKNRAYWRSMPERFGWLSFQPTAPGGIWLHAVSVGEVVAALGLIGQLRSAFPGTPVYVSVSTLAGRKLADQKLKQVADGIFYVPLDFVFSVRRVFRLLQPSLVVVMETEIWPNLWREAKHFGAQLVVANGRISDRALPKYQRLRWFFQHVLTVPDFILTQSRQDLDRYLSLGAPRATTENAGNLKYDFDVSGLVAPEDVRRFIESLGAEKILIAASTMPGLDKSDVDEDDAVLGAWPEWGALFPKLLLILVPRRPERFALVAEKLRALQIPFTRRTEMGDLRLPGVLLLDSMGELGGLFPLADLVFMGGSIAQRGGHNILEPALFGKPVIAGPHMENFAEIAADFTEGGGLARFADSQGLTAAVVGLLKDPDRSLVLGGRARTLALERRGATARIVERLKQQMDRAVPVFVIPFWRHILLGPLAMIWGHVSRWNLNRKRDAAEHLETPVISIGGLGMGGAGKTPFTLWLAERLKRAGEKPAFLTRGYKRKTAEAVSIFSAGELCSVARTGEEAQMLVRSAIGPVGIAAERVLAARELEQRFAPSVLLMDDGFQHTQLARQCDLVLIDTLDPFAHGAPFPLGWLREYPDGLSRASAVILTRTKVGRRYTGLQAALRNLHPNLPIFLSRVVPLSFVAAANSECFPLDHLQGKRVAAFCGLGNPSSFWDTLGQLDCNVVFRWSFGDHHVYKPQELKRLEHLAIDARAEVMVTTQKDLFNLSSDARAMVRTMPIYWLDIATQVDDGDGLVSLVTERLR